MTLSSICCTNNYLQAHVVVEVCIWSALVLKRTQVWLQRMCFKQLGKQVATGEVLQ